MGYKFRWMLPGVEGDRPVSGKKVPLALYRLMYYALENVLKVKYGRKAADDVFFTAGKLAGIEFYNRYIEPVTDLDKFISKTQKLLKKKIGILQIEEDLLKQGTVLLTIEEMDEDLYCFGLPELDDKPCSYDEGFISALFEQLNRKKWQTKGIDCWSMGARTCRFLVNETKIFRLQPKTKLIVFSFCKLVAFLICKSTIDFK
ncbi:MAG: 4-vinyl reductase [Sporomusa sp.]|jgi:predicted hydrocarbon binding protein|nr:4-vinyl reductase [Sporomusa sp.]